MRRTKLWSVLLTAALLCACVAGVLFLGASAEEGEPVYRYVVNSGAAEDTESEPKTFPSLEAALVFAAGDERLTPEPCSLEITLETDTEVWGHATAYALYDVRTIWCGSAEDGTLKKLPITIQGASETSLPRLEWGGTSIRIECTNDYTFRNVELPWGGFSSAHYFSCGSGNIRFENAKVVSAVEGSEARKNLYFYCSTYASTNIFTSEPARTAWTPEQKAAVANEDGTYTAQTTFGKGFSFPGTGAADHINFNLRSSGTMNYWSGGFGNTKTKLKFLFETGCDVSGQRIYGATKAVSADQRVDEMIIEVEKDVNYHTIFVVGGNYSVYGNATVITNGVTSANGVRGCQYGDLYGNFTLRVGPDAGGPGVLQGAWSNQTGDDPTALIDGDLTVVIDGTKNFTGNFDLVGQQAQCTGKIDVTVKNGAKIGRLAVKNGPTGMSCQSIDVRITKDPGVTESPELQTFFAGSSSSTSPVAVEEGIHTIVDCGSIGTYYGGSVGPLTGSVTNEINGGKFGTFFGAGTGAVDGSVQTTFDGTCTVYYSDSVKTHATSFVYTTQVTDALNTAGGAVTGEVVTTLKSIHLNSAAVNRSEGDILNVCGEDESDCITLSTGKNFVFDNFEMNGGTINFYKSHVTVENAKGTVNVRHTGEWTPGEIYFSFMPAEGESIDVLVNQSVGVNTRAIVLEKSGVTYVLGRAAAAGVKLNVSDRLLMKVYLDKEMVDSMARLGDFDYSVTLAGEEIAQGSELKEDGTYYYFETSRFGLGQFTDTISISGSMMNPYGTSILSLANTLAASETDSDEWKAWGASLANLVEVAVNDGENAIQPEDKAYDAFETTKGSASASLVMDSAVGVQLKLDLAAPLTNAKVLVNGETDCTECYADGTLTLMIKASALETPIDIQILDGETEVFAIQNLSLAYLAKSLGTDAGNALLAFIQASSVVA